MNFVGLLHAGPTIIAEGTPEQRQRFLPADPPGRRGVVPGLLRAGRRQRPGLAAHPGRAGRRRVRGHRPKIWTSHAEVADYCELLVRTGAEDSRHRGITWLILPMDTPGVEIRPLTTIAGSTEFAELFLDEVRVPVANRVGRRRTTAGGSPWSPSASSGAPPSSATCSRPSSSCPPTVALARRTGAWDDPGVRRQAGHLRAEFDALSALTKRNVSQAARTGIPGIGGTFFKLAYTEARTKLGEFSLSLLGRAGLAADDLEGTDGSGPSRRDHGRGLAAGHLADHRRRHVADPAQHRRRAHPRAAQGAQLGPPSTTAHRSPLRPRRPRRRGRTDAWTSN